MKLKSLAIAAVAAISLPAFAAISPGITTSGVNAPYNGNGELFLVVFDSDAKVSYTYDMGVTQNAFFAAAQADAGYTANWSVADANLTSFLGQVSAANLQWSVLAFDQTGGTAVGGVRLFATLKNGDESKLGELTNQNFTNGTGSTQAGTFFNAVNLTGTHGASGQAPLYSVNGSSVNRDSDSGNSYYGDGSVGLSTTLNGRATFSMANAVGTASSFYYLTRSGANQSASVLVDTFDNAAGKGSFLLAQSGPGYELTYTLAPVPEPGTFAMLLAGFLTVGAMARRRGAV